MTTIHQQHPTNADATPDVPSLQTAAQQIPDVKPMQPVNALRVRTGLRAGTVHYGAPVFAIDLVPVTSKHFEEGW